MARDVPIHWKGERAVLQPSEAVVRKMLAPLRKDRTKVMRAVLGTPEHEADLIGICQDHFT